MRAQGVCKVAPKAMEGTDGGVPEFAVADTEKCGGDGIPVHDRKVVLDREILSLGGNCAV